MSLFLCLSFTLSLSPSIRKGRFISRCGRLHSYVYDPVSGLYRIGETHENYYTRRGGRLLLPGLSWKRISDEAARTGRVTRVISAMETGPGRPWSLGWCGSLGCLGSKVRDYNIPGMPFRVHQFGTPVPSLRSSQPRAPLARISSAPSAFSSSSSSRSFASFASFTPAPFQTNFHRITCPSCSPRGERGRQRERE